MCKTLDGKIVGVELSVSSRGSVGIEAAHPRPRSQVINDSRSLKHRSTSFLEPSVMASFVHVQTSLDPLYANRFLL
jgi:hypothetical protein